MFPVRVSAAIATTSLSQVNAWTRVAGDERRLSWLPEMYAIYRFWRNRNDVRACSEVVGAPGSIWTNDEGVVRAFPGEVDGIVSMCYR